MSFRLSLLASLSLLLAAGCAASSGGAADEGGATDPTASTGDTLNAKVSTTGSGDAPGAVAQAAGSAGTASPVKLPYRGINLAGGEFGTAIPGKLGVDYAWPTAAEVDYFLGKGMNTFRIGFKWERLQPVKNGPLDATYLAGLAKIVRYATGKGAHVILNPHNFARYYGALIGSSAVPNAAFADFWGRLAAQFKDDPRVIFNLVNEPHDIPTEQWVSAANAAILAIRGTGATNQLHVPGNGWTGAHAWTSRDYGTPNAVAMLAIDDPADNVRFEVHQYLDGNSGGASQTCVSETIGSERMKGFVDWLRANGKKGFLGEFAGGNNPTCQAAVADLLAALRDASDVMDGWLWWAAGPFWQNYGYSLEPTNGKDAAQLAWLLPALADLPAAAP